MLDGTGTGSSQTMDEILCGRPSLGRNPSGRIFHPFALCVEKAMRMDPVTPPHLLNPAFWGPTAGNFQKKEKPHAVELGFGDLVVEADLGMSLLKGIGMEVGGEHMTDL